MADVPLDRRAFGCTLAASGAAALAGCGAAPPAPPKLEPPVATKDPPKTEAVPPKVEPVDKPTLTERKPAELLLDLVRQQYPERLEPAHLATIQGELQRQLARSQVLSSFPLTNADEPAPVFAAYRGPD
jgi:hypothetical protein